LASVVTHAAVIMPHVLLRIYIVLKEDEEEKRSERESRIANTDKRNAISRDKKKERRQRQDLLMSRDGEFLVQ
jgi:hypothetical protein